MSYPARTLALLFGLAFCAGLAAPAARANAYSDEETLAARWDGKTIYNRVDLRFSFHRTFFKAASTNFHELPELLPVGTALEVTEVTYNSITLKRAGSAAPLRLEFVAKHTLIPFGDYLERTFSLRPVSLPAALTAAERDAIANGSVVPGMSRQAVLLAIGYPPATHNASFDAKTLIYQRTRFSKFNVIFDSNNRVTAIEGLAPATEPSATQEGRIVYNRVNLRARFTDPNYATSSTNYIAYSKLFPVGSKFTIVKQTSDSVNLQVSGGTIVELEYVAGHTQMPLAEYLERTFAAAPVALPSTLSARERKLVEGGLAEVGMSRAAVFLALGYPPGNLNPSMSAAKLLYMTKPARKTALHFDAADKVTRIDP